MVVNIKVADGTTHTRGVTIKALRVSRSPPSLDSATFTRTRFSFTSCAKKTPLPPLLPPSMHAGRLPQTILLGREHRPQQEGAGVLPNISVRRGGRCLR